MADRMKESLFSALGDLTGLEVLDLYAGSGSLGLEALSRGARRATFVESAREAIVRLESNIEATGLGERAEVQWADVGSALSRPASRRVDLVFLDPPYSSSPQAVLRDLEALVMGGFLSDEGRIVLHRPARETTPVPLGLDRQWERDYGQARIVVFCHAEDEG
jgi:16S rRNA (guanine966-N2)-methyltransferase